DGTRVAKSHTRVCAYGEVDELNAVLGWCKCSAEGSPLHDQLAQMQSDLFVLGAELARGEANRPGPAITSEQIARLERWIDASCAATPPLRHFILPGGTELAARLHVARAVSRRAERQVVLLSQQD